MTQIYHLEQVEREMSVLLLSQRIPKGWNEGTIGTTTGGGPLSLWRRGFGTSGTRNDALDFFLEQMELYALYILKEMILNNLIFLKLETINING